MKELYFSNININTFLIRVTRNLGRKEFTIFIIKYFFFYLIEGTLTSSHSTFAWGPHCLLRMPPKGVFRVGKLACWNGKWLGRHCWSLEWLRAARAPLPDRCGYKGSEVQICDCWVEQQQLVLVSRAGLRKRRVTTSKFIFSKKGTIPKISQK